MAVKKTKTRRAVSHAAKKKKRVQGGGTTRRKKVSVKARSSAAKKKRSLASKSHIGGDVLKDIDGWLENDEFRLVYERVRQNITVDLAVKRIMAHQNWTVRALAKTMGTSLSQVQRLMEGKNVTIDTLAKFAAATESDLEINLE